MLIELLTPAQTSTLLGVTEGTLMIWRCTKRYPLDFVKIGGRVMYQRQDVERFVESRIVHCGPGSDLTITIKELGLSPRTHNLLVWGQSMVSRFPNSRVKTLGDLIQKREVELLCIRNFGRKSLNEVKEVLASMNLKLRS